MIRSQTIKASQKQIAGIFLCLVIATLVGIAIGRTGLLAAQLVAAVGLLMPAVVAVLFKWPELGILVLAAPTFVLNEIDVEGFGFPDIGLNLLDLILLGLLILLFIRLVVGPFNSPNYTVWLALTLCFWGTAAGGIGFLQGNPIRGILRDYRFFPYLLVTYLYVYLTFTKVEQIWRSALIFFLLFPIEMLLVATGNLRVLASVPQGVLLPSAAYESAWHFLRPQFYFPLYISIALLAIGQLTVRRQALLWLVSGVSVVVLLLSFTRGLWLTTSSTLAIGFLIARKRRLIRSPGLGWMAILIFLATAAFVVVLSSSELVGWVSLVLARLASSFDLGEVSTAGRISESWILVQTIIQNPLSWLLGNGLGELGPLGGGATHNGYLFIAYSVGLPALAIVIYIITDTVKTGLGIIRSATVSPNAQALALGLCLSLIAVAVGALSSTTMVDVIALPFWGLVVGLIHCLHNLSKQYEDRTAVSVLTGGTSG